MQSSQRHVCAIMPDNSRWAVLRPNGELEYVAHCQMDLCGKSSIISLVNVELASNRAVRGHFQLDDHANLENASGPSG